MDWQSDSGPRLLTIAEAAALLRLAPKSLQRLARRGTIPGVIRVNRSVRFDAVVLEAFIARGGDARG